METSGGEKYGIAGRASATSSLSTSSSLYSSGDDSTEDDPAIAAALAEDGNSANINNTYGQQHRLGRRLSHLDSIPHTPRVNNEIPDANDATFDHERLSERLSTYGLAELQIEGDGNCQFRALADQLFRNPDYHKHVRKQVVKQLKRFKRLYEGYVPMRYKDYLKKMKKLGEWGDHVTLQAAADRFGAKICLVTSFRDTCYIEILPKDKNPSRGDEFGDNGLIEALLNVKLKKGFTTAVEEIWLSFWSEVHYNSLYETGEVPTRVPKKRFWFF